MEFNLNTIKTAVLSKFNLDTFKGAFFSKTIWASILVTLLPYSEYIIGITFGLSPVMGGMIGIAFAALRVVTVVPLAEK